MVATESGVLGERASYRDILVWQDEQREHDRADLQAVLSTMRSPQARAQPAGARGAGNIDALDVISLTNIDQSFSSRRSWALAPRPAP